MGTPVDLDKPTLFGSNASTPDPIWNNPMLEAYTLTLRKYAVFSGRTSRSEFWQFVLVQTVIFVAAIILAVQIHEAFALLLVLYLLGTLIPTLAAMARRLHDIGRSIGWLLLGVGLGSLCLTLALYLILLGTFLFGVVLVDYVYGIPEWEHLPQYAKQEVHNTIVEEAWALIGLSTIPGLIGVSLVTRLLVLLTKPAEWRVNKYGTASHLIVV